jgi:ribosomal protein S8
MWMVAPSTFQFRNPVTNVIEVFPAYYMAAAIAGYLSSVPAYTPLTHKVMSGFWGRNERHTKADKTRLSGSGMLYVDEYNGSLRVLHGRTTAQNGVILDEETNIVLAKHIIIKVMRDLYSSGYIGSVINQDTLMMVKSSAQSTLSTLLRAGYMSEVTYISVEQDDVVQTQINVSFEYRPSYSLNYIEITFSVDATTSAA